MKRNKIVSIVLSVVLALSLGMLPQTVRSQFKLTTAQLQVKQPSGAKQPWSMSLVIHHPGPITFRWLSTDPSAKFANWQVSNENLLLDISAVAASKVLAKGSAGNAPPKNQFTEFTVNFADFSFVPKTAPKTAIDYYLRVVPLADPNTFAGTLSLSVRIRYVEPSLLESSTITPIAGGYYTDLGFYTAAPTNASAQASTKKPNGYVFNPADVQSESNKETGYTNHHFVRLPKLKPNTVFNYVLTVTDKDGKKDQIAGSFHTLRRMVLVHFTELDVDDDSDDLGAGELSFSFFTNGKYTGSYPGNGCQDMDTGAKKMINVANVIFDAPDALPLEVLGADDDLSDYFEDSMGSCFGAGITPGTGDGENAIYDWASVKGTVNVAGNPNGPPEGTPEGLSGVPFTLKKSNAKLKYTVKGAVDVYYVQP